MNGESISDILRRFGRGLKETRAMMPVLTEAIRKQRALRPPAIPRTPLFLTAHEVRGMELVTEAGEPFELEPDWMLKVVPPVDGQEPSLSYITPEDWLLPMPGKWEITLDDKFISPEGKVYTGEQLEAQLAAPTVAPVEVPPAVTPAEPLEAEKVTPEQDVAEVLAYAEADPEVFAEDVLAAGWSPEMEDLLLSMYPGVMTRMEIRHFFKEVTPEAEAEADITQPLSIEYYQARFPFDITKPLVPPELSGGLVIKDEKDEVLDIPFTVRDPYTGKDIELTLKQGIFVWRGDKLEGFFNPRGDFITTRPSEVSIWEKTGAFFSNLWKSLPLNPYWFKSPMEKWKTERKAALIAWAKEADIENPEEYIEEWLTREVTEPREFAWEAMEPEERRLRLPEIPTPPIGEDVTVGERFIGEWVIPMFILSMLPSAGVVRTALIPAAAKPGVVGVAAKATRVALAPAEWVTTYPVKYLLNKPLQAIFNKTVQRGFHKYLLAQGVKLSPKAERALLRAFQNMPVPKTGAALAERVYASMATKYGNKAVVAYMMSGGKLTPGVIQQVITFAQTKGNKKLLEQAQKFLLRLQRSGRAEAGVELLHDKFAVDFFEAFKLAGGKITTQTGYEISKIALLEAQKYYPLFYQTGVALEGASTQTHNLVMNNILPPVMQTAPANITPGFIASLIPKGVALTVTEGLLSQLRDLGHTDKAITAMKPEEAWANLFKAPVAEAVAPPAVPPAVPEVVLPPAVSTKIAETHNTIGGASFDIKGKNLVGTDAFAVGVHTDRAVFLPTEKVTEADIRAFVSKNADLLRQPEYVIGTWFDEEIGKSVLVVSTLRPNLESAMDLARAEGQKEVFNLKTQERIPIPIVSKFTEIQPIEFNVAVGKAPKQEFLTRYSVEELNRFRLFLSEDKLVGYAIKPDGDLVNVFNASGIKGAGQEAIVQAIAQGAIKLDAIGDDFLTEYYEDAGFKVVKREAWNEEYAPKDWDYKKYGRPDIIYMEYPKEGSRNATDIRTMFTAARVRHLAAFRRGQGPPAPPVTEIGRPERGAAPLAEQVPLEGPVRVPAEPVVTPEVVKPPVEKPPAKPITPELSDKRASEAVTEPRPSVEQKPESVPRGTTRHPKFAQSEEDIRLDLKQEFHDTFEGSVLGEPSASYLRDGDFDKFVELMPTIEELKLEALSDEIRSHIAELEELRPYILEGRDLVAFEKIIKKLRGKKTLTIEDAASLGIALRKTRGGNVLPAIRRSGFYVTTDFVEYTNFEDVGYTSGRWMDTMTLFEAIDGGYATGMAQKDILYPTHITHLARDLFVDVYSYKADKLCEQFGLETDKRLRKVAWNVVQQISKEEADFKTADLVRKPEIQTFISKYDRATQTRLVEFSQGVRALLDDLINKQNMVRTKRGQDSIAYREKYLAWVAESNIWSKLGWMRKTPADFFQKPPLPDYIKPDAPFNPRAMAREGGMRGYEMERDVRKLLKDYVNTAGKDIFNTNIIHNAKIHTATLRSMGYENTARLIEDWASESYAGVLTGIEKGFRGIVPRPILRSIWFLRRQLTRAVFPLNWLWNVTIQPSSIAFTNSRYGVRNTIRGLAYLFDSDTKAYVRERYSWIIKAKRGGKMAYQDIGQQVSGNVWTEGRLIDKAEMIGNFMTNLIEEKLTGISIIAARHHGESLGFTGLDLDEFASKGGAKTQSMYNFEDLPGVLRSKTIGSLFPFQTFCFQAMNFVRELNIIGIRKIVGKAGAYHTISATSAEGKATISRRIKMVVEFLITIMVINMVVDRAINRKPWRVTSFIPFYANLIAGMDAGNTWNWPLPAQYVAEFWAAFNAVIKYDEWTKLRKWSIRYHIMGGTQINKAVDGAIALARGEVTDTRGKTMFEVNPDEWLKVIMMGPYASEEGREYVDRIKEKRGGLWYEYTGFPLPERVDITDEIDKSIELLGKTDDEGAPHDFGDVVSDIRELRRIVGEKRFSLCVSPFVEGFRQAEASREEFEKLPPEKLENMDVNEIADFIFPEADPEDEEITALWTNFNTLKTTQEKRDFVANYIKEHSKELKGNEVANNYSLLQDMWALEGKDLKAFLEKYPALTRNWRDEWRKENPEDDARLSMWAYGGRIQTREAYALIVKWCGELGIDIKHLDAWLPPPEIAETYFDYNEKGEEFGWNSWECQIILASDEAFREWKGLDMPESPIEALELKTDPKYREIYNKLQDKDFLDALNDTIKDENGLTERDRYIAELKTTKITDEYTYRDMEKKVEAIEKGTNEVPISDEIVNAHIEYFRLLDQEGIGATSAEVMLFRIDNDAYNQSRLDESIWGSDYFTEDVDRSQEPKWRIQVKYRAEDEKYDVAIPKKYEDMSDEAVNATPAPEGINTNWWARQTAEDKRNILIGVDRATMLAGNEAYRKDRLRIEAYEKDFPDIEGYVTYYELPVKGYRQERMLIDNPAFAKAMHTIKSIDLPDPKEVPSVRYDEVTERWQADFDKLEGLADHKSEHYIENVDDRALAREAMRFKAGKLTEFGKAEIRRKGYKLFVPEKYIDRFVEFDSIRAEGKPEWYDRGIPEKNRIPYYADEWYLWDHPLFYKDIYLGLLGLEEIDFSKVPTPDQRYLFTPAVFALYRTYLGIPGVTAKENYRARFPKLDALGVLALGWAPIGQRGKKEAPKTPWERAAEAERFKELF